MPTRALLFMLLLTAPLAVRADDLVTLLLELKCPECHLADVDLVHADLRDADLQRAQLQRANLGRARLDGADLRDADLRLSSLQGASLRGADLRGSRLFGTDLRHADLTGAQLDDGALEQAHWEGARGISQGVRSHATLHNAGVTAAEKGDWKRAEDLFSAAITAASDKPLSWVARGLSRGELGKNALAANDLAYAGTLFRERGDHIKADQMKLASRKALEGKGHSQRGGSGVGSAILAGGISTLRILGPMALSAFSLF